jgi:hypothetical protein
VIKHEEIKSSEILSDRQHKEILVKYLLGGQYNDLLKNEDS